MSRSSWKGPYIIRSLLKNYQVRVKIAETTKSQTVLHFQTQQPLEIWSRASVIPISVIGRKAKIYAGCKFKHINCVFPSMVGYKFGDFALSYQKKNFTKNKKVQKKK